MSGVCKPVAKVSNWLNCSKISIMMMFHCFINHCFIESKSVCSSVRPGRVEAEKGARETSIDCELKKLIW